MITILSKEVNNIYLFTLFKYIPSNILKQAIRICDVDVIIMINILVINKGRSNIVQLDLIVTMHTNHIIKLA